MLLQGEIVHLHCQTFLQKDDCIKCPYRLQRKSGARQFNCILQGLNTE